MNYFITGASGFIGKALIKKLLLIEKNKIFALSRRKNNNLKLDNRNIKWIKGNLKSDVKEYLKKTDVLIHLATKFDNNPSAKIYETNLIDSLNFFGKAKQYGVKKYFVAGSGFEHGNSKENILPLSVLKPTTDYQISKAIFNIKICNWAKKNTLNLTYMKIFQAYGPGENKNRLYPQIIKSAKEDKKLNINRYAKYIIRDFIELDKIINDIIFQIHDNKGVNISNCCSGKKMSVLNFSKIKWKEFSLKKSKIITKHAIKPVPTSNFGLRKINNIDNVSYTFNKLYHAK